MLPLPASDQKLHGEGLLDFAMFGLDRIIPDWVNVDTSFPILDIGPGTKSIDWATDRLEYPQYDFEGQTIRQRVWDRGVNGGHHFEAVSVCTTLLPYDNGSVGGIYAVNILEHLWDPRPFIAECARVLAPGCPFNIFVPHPESIMYRQDLDHKSQFVLDTWDNLLYSDYYDKGRTTADGGRIPFRVGANVKFALKEENTAVITQLVKLTVSEEAELEDFLKAGE